MEQSPCRKDDRLNQLLPLGMADRMRPTQWEEIITVQYKSLLGFDKIQCQQGYLYFSVQSITSLICILNTFRFLEFIRHMPCYGSSFFPVCAELPPSGFFEFRTQNWFLGSGPNGMCIIDTDVQVPVIQKCLQLTNPFILEICLSSELERHQI